MLKTNGGQLEPGSEPATADYTFTYQGMQKDMWLKFV